MKRIYPMCEDDCIAACGSGWYSLINRLIKEVNRLNEEVYDDDFQIEILQIKEKFGQLRFYVSHGTSELFDLIHATEDESYDVCEYCGSKENIGYTKGWIRTLCKKCATKNNFLEKWKEKSTETTDGI